ncbi:AAA family ATPase [Prevotella sp.]|uniref:AAA family ATPase n=1 Tax=Prevotella sp. TaxID=59823 RepID=UPI0027E3A86D|nr:ATP-binding protein [Prevotella sp.]
MNNPFKFGSVVDEPYFTDRINELAYIKHSMNSANHIVLISPRRFGKTSLVKKAIKEINRPSIFINLQMAVSVENLASLLLKEIFKLRPFKKVKHLMTHFRVIPTISTNPFSDAVDVSFQPSLDTTAILEDAFALLEKVSSPTKRIITVFDEFQEIMGIEKGLDKRLRAIMQEQQNINYIFLGSQESMMTQIFERKKSPFYHFGMLMHLDKIPYDDFMQYITQRLPLKYDTQAKDIAKDILNTTLCHPYFTQQLASQVWEILTYSDVKEDIVKEAVEQLTIIHDLDFERLWMNFNKTDKYILLNLAHKKQPSSTRSLPTSTIYSSVKRLMQMGYIIKTNEYEIEDPFFRNWLIKKQG